MGYPLFRLDTFFSHCWVHILTHGWLVRFFRLDPHFGVGETWWFAAQCPSCPCCHGTFRSVPLEGKSFSRTPTRQVPWPSKRDNLASQVAFSLFSVTVAIGFGVKCMEKSSNWPSRELPIAGDSSYRAQEPQNTNLQVREDHLFLRRKWAEVFFCVLADVSFMTLSFFRVPPWNLTAGWMRLLSNGRPGFRVDRGIIFHLLKNMLFIYLYFPCWFQKEFITTGQSIFSRVLTKWKYCFQFSTRRGGESDVF